MSKSTTSAVAAKNKGTAITRTMARDGINPHLKGHVPEIPVKYGSDLLNLFNGSSTQVPKNAKTKGGKVIERIQVKDVTSSAGVRKIVNQVASGKYRSVQLVGSEETTEMGTAALKKAGLSKRMVSSGVSSDTTTSIPKLVDVIGFGTSGGAKLKADKNRQHRQSCNRRGVEVVKGVKTPLADLAFGNSWNDFGGKQMTRENKMSGEGLKVAASAVGGGAVGTAGSLAAVSTLGAVEGLSAAGMTSGLAALGSLAGGGMAAGIGVAAVPVLAGGALAAALTSDNIKTDEKIAAGLGAGAGITGSVATVSAAGAVSGLSAAGITSGLTAIGGVVGGGMCAGIAITCTAPLAVAGGAYALYKWLKD